MALINWKSLKCLDAIIQNENVVKMWSKFRGKYLLIILKSSCQTDVDIRVMSLNEEVRRILHSLKSSLMIPLMIMMPMATMRREMKLGQICACLCWPSTNVREEFDGKNSLAQPFDDKDCEDDVEKDVGKSSHLLKSPAYLACAYMPNANKFGHSQASNPCSVSAGIKVNKFRSSLVAMMLFLRPQMADWTLDVARKEGR